MIMFRNLFTILLQGFGDMKKLTKVASDRRNVPDDTDNVFDREVRLFVLHSTFSGLKN